MLKPAAMPVLYKSALRMISPLFSVSLLATEYDERNPFPQRRDWGVLC
jgi:hypothetical protein